MNRITVKSVVQNVRNNPPHMGFKVMEFFAQESWKFDLFLDTKTLIAPVKLKLESSFLKFCLKAQIGKLSSAVLLTP